MPQRWPSAKNASAISVICSIFLLSFTFLSAQDDCAEEFQKADFPPSVVNKVLEKFRIPPIQWASINRELTLQLNKLEGMVARKAALLTPNPFNAPQQKVVIGRLYRDARLEIFEKVMKENGVKGKKEIYDMFDQIQYEKASLIWECYQKERGN